MTLTQMPDNPDRYVREHKDTLVRIIKHGDDQFVRSLALAVLVEYGDDPDLEELRSDLERISKVHQARVDS